MNVGLLMVLALTILAAGYLVWGRVAARVAGIDPGRPTPAVRNQDGVDFVPTRPLVLFGHHYASIAAAGPIIGPALALAYGYLPALLWMLGGVIFIGAVHDFMALFVTTREGGRSLAEVARVVFGKPGFFFFATFALMLCILATAAFLDLTARALASLHSLRELKMPHDQRLLGTQPHAAALGQWDDAQWAQRRQEALQAGVPEEVLEHLDAARRAGPAALAELDRQAAADKRLMAALYHFDGEMARIGGIASTSAIVITLLSPLIGWLLYRRRVSVALASALALGFTAASVGIGFALPVAASPRAWTMIIAAYCVVSGWLAVWLVLQPRDFVNVHLLYIALAAMVGGLLACGMRGVEVAAPPQNIAAALELPKLGPLWPILFVTIACGSVSGAHGLICGGTTCKQITSEAHARPIGYGAMLLETVLGVCVVLSLSTLPFSGGTGAYMQLVHDRGNAPLGFALGVANVLHTGFGLPPAYGVVFGILMLEGFLVTTIDTIIRLSRYLIEEFLKTFLGVGRVGGAGRLAITLGIIAVVVALALSQGYGRIWALFGSSNQLLAALTLTVVTVWLAVRGRPFWMTLVPALFMLATTIAALVEVARHNLHDPVLLGMDALLMLLALGFVAMAVRQAAARRSTA